MRLSIQHREALWFYILISPWIFGFLTFTAGPLLASLYFSFTQYNIVSAPKWVGLENYGMLISDPLFWKSLRISTTYTAVSVPLGLILSLTLALMLNQPVLGVRFFRTIFYLPTAISGVALAVLSLWLFNSDFGLINYLIWSLTGLRGPLWMQSETWVLPTLIIISFWSVGGIVVIYLAGLRGIPIELYEAAELDGATLWYKFRSITLPLLSPVIFFTAVISMIGSFQVFTVAQVSTLGGPNYASFFYVLYLYQMAFRSFQMGYASALAWVLFLIVLLLTILAFRSSGSWVYYEDHHS